MKTGRVIENVQQSKCQTVQLGHFDCWTPKKQGAYEISFVRIGRQRKSYLKCPKVKNLTQQFGNM